MNIATPVGSLLKSVDFGFIDDIEKLSVKQITNPEVFDSLGHPVTGGLYDLALGAFFKNICGTCGLDERFCTGHIGHIELPVPLYNPMFFPNMYLLLRSCCLYCHRLRLSASKSHFFECKLRLLQYGLLLEASVLDENYGMTRAGSGDESDDVKAQTSEHLANRENYVTKCISDAIRDGRATAAGVRTPLVLQERKAVIKEFNRLILSRKKCENCSAYSPAYRKDGLSKIFEIPLSDKQQNHNRAKGTLRRAMIFDTESANSGSHVDTKGATGTRYVLSSEVCNILRAVFRNEQSLFNVVFQIKPGCEQHVSSDMFFTHKILVPPTRYRLPSQLGDEVHANPTNEILVKCLQCCLRIRDLNNELRQLQLTKDSHESRRNVFTQLMNTFVSLQNEYNGFLDNTKNQNQSNKLNPLPGIKQHLEKKEGLFRKNMMGKRVNFAARSVISPDPNLETNEIGIPPVFALKLTYPEPVTTHNFSEMHRAVVNGPDIWPGATAVQNENGHLVSLIGMTVEQRTAIANQLMTPSTGTSATQISASAAGQTPAVNKKVLRHIRDQDVVLMNRQPTLHKASMMGHSVRVLPKEKTLRLHYANTGAYNADFDGDEMNMHFPQNESARTEALLLANTNSQYLTPTSGKPLRGLIQDHISAGVWLTNKDSFFTREQYHQLIFGSIRPETGQFASSKVLLVDPAVLRPIPLWTGKQVISTILLNIKAESMPGLNLKSKNKVKGEYWSADSEENTVLFKDGHLLCGILDKSQYGAADYGLVHAVHEIYGPVKAGLLLSVLGRLFTKYIMDTAFTCGMDDLRLTAEGDKWRKDLLQKANDVGRAAAVEVTNLDESGSGSEKELKKRLEEILRDDNKLGILDAITQSKANAVTSQVVSTCIPNGVEKAFPYNSMQTMALSGAKGSNVNVSQIMCGLGQQALEGRRVPVMVSGKTLPSFKPFETHVKAGGYIAGRFYSGIRPQEYYFHCMAGREGLIDTAVKTSRSGYLQRCLIKQLEGVAVRYDNTVRDADGTLVQFVYGGDSVDVVRESYLKQFDFCRDNFESLVVKHNPEWAGELNDTDALVYTKKTKKHLKKHPDSDKYDPVIMKYNPARYIGAVSENFQRDLDNYIHDTKDLKAEGLDKKFKSLMQLKYQQSLVDPGECVGIIASQSIGEPSTQMTLNTFHFAGHGAANVTLGIPRMREIIMTASPNIKTPQMILPIRSAISDAQADTFAKSITRIRLSQLVDKVIVTEKTGPNGFGDYVRSYSVKVQLFTKSEYENEYDITQRDVEQTLTNKFLEMLHTTIHKEFTRQKRQAAQAGASFVPVVKVAKKTPPSKSESLVDAEASESDDESDSDADMDDAKTSNRLEAENQENDEELAEEAEESDGQEDEIEDDDAAKEEEEEDEDVEMADASSSEDELPRMVLKGSARDREQAVFRMHPDVTRFNFDDEAGEWCEFTMEYDSATKKLLMVNLIEDVCRRCVVREIAGIDRCLRPANHKDGRVLVTEGVNFRAMWMDDLLLDPNGILSNDVAAVLRTYGVEAARATIAREISNVFETYAITVNHRHLELIADMMTREGTYLPFSRQGLDLAISPFLKMSFESTCQFMTRAVVEGYQDDLDTPSARVVVGRPMCAGTGAFDVFTQAPISAL